MRVDHDIFHTPHQVALTIAPQPTPPDYRGEGLADTMPMWRVQTEGYLERTEQLIGVVASDRGFLTSPDTEWISSGVNSKSSRAVAIGRHGNFLGWGFAASPTYLTDEAKLVFVNAVHYIARFDGQAPIARKVKGTALRSYVVEALEGITEAGYRQALQRHEQWLAEDAQRRAAVRAAIAAGDEVSDFDRELLDRPAPTPPGRFDRIRRFVPKADWPAIADDEQAIRAWFADRLSYMRSVDWFELAVDEELRALRLANDDVAMLARCVADLERGQDVARARALLTRYTTEAFETDAEWVAWFAQNREHLFFDETCGYKWIVDSLGAPPPLPATSEGAPLQAVAFVERGEDGARRVVVKVAIQPGWHAYVATRPGASVTPIELALQLPEGLRQQGDWLRPPGAPSETDANVLEVSGEVTFSCELAGERADRAAEVSVLLSYQVCNEERCDRPTQVELIAPLRPQRSSR